jgi:hypothetical protein
MKPLCHLVTNVLLVLVCLSACANRALPTVSPEKGFRLAFTEIGALAPSSVAVQNEIVKAAENAPDVFIFSHGWWNTPDKAECQYSKVITEIQKRKPDFLPSNYRPLLVGIYWPSAIFPVEKGEDCGTPPPSPKDRGEGQEGFLESG